MYYTKRMELNSACAIITAHRMDADELTAAIFHRPVCAAWLVNEQGLTSDNGTQAISELAQACCRWWEGRNSLLIHVTEKGLAEDAQRILRNHDPDEVIALGPLSKKVVEDVDRTVHPLVFSRRTHIRGPISQADFQLHTIASLPSSINLSRRNDSLFDDSPPSLLLFAFRSKCPAAIRHCVTLNFGTYAHVERAQDGQPDFGLASRLWTDLPPRLYVLGNVDDFAAALDEIAGDWHRAGLRFVAPMQLAEGPHDVRHRWPTDERYQVFVGDSFEDADLFWHQPIVDGSWRLCSRFRFYLPSSLARDPKLQTSLQKWLKRFTNAGSSNHKAPLFISKSLNHDDVQEVADHLLVGNRFGISRGTAEHWDGLQFPKNSNENEPPVILSQLERLGPVETSQMNLHGDTLHVSRPEILAPEQQAGRWMADVFLQMPPERRIERNRDSFWRLPSARGQDLVSAMFHGAGRIKTNGYPTVAVGGARPKITLHIPRPFNVFATLIRGERNYSITTDLRHELPQPASAHFEVRVSDKGQRYRGTVDLFGTLGTAAHYFESVLWREIFRDLASEKASTHRALESEIKGLLNKVYRQAAPSQHDEAVRRMMDKIQGRSKEVRLTLGEMDETLKKLRDGPRPFPVEQHIGNTILRDDSKCPYGEQTLEDGLTHLMARGVIEAGFEYTCVHCGSVSWLALGRAAQHGECPDCGTRWSAEAEMPWRYRLTSLAKRAVQRSGGAMPVLLAIWGLFVESKGSFLWHPNLEIYRPDHEAGQKPWHELDIICLVDGRFTIGEVKDDISQFVDSDFNDLHEMCESMQPDVALLVFLEGDYAANRAFAQRFTNLQSRLSPRTQLEWRKIARGW
jgi:hypothetical protein